MILVPGLLFTNAMRDIIYGDTNSGVNRIVQVLLVAVALALGTATAWNLAAHLWGAPVSAAPLTWSMFAQCIFGLIGCIGFGILFNVHSLGLPLCAMGGCLTWLVYLLTFQYTDNIYLANFWATAFAAAYSEALARIRKYPATSYLVVSLFPLLPGAGIYYTMGYALEGSVNLAVHKGLQTAAIAGVMAVGILLVSTATRALMIWKFQKKTK
jgi:uncharacterized membrane protein YjjB (DUF3815 family)